MADSTDAVMAIAAMTDVLVDFGPKRVVQCCALTTSHHVSSDSSQTYNQIGLSTRYDLSVLSRGNGYVCDRFSPCLIVTRYSRSLGSVGVAWL